MGSFLDKPKTDKTNENGKGNDLRYGLAAMQGWRIEMEDSHSSVIGLPMAGLEAWSFFAVFDGHAGGNVSKFSSKELINSILNADPDLFSELAALYSSSSNQNNQTSNTSEAAPAQQRNNDNRYEIFYLFLVLLLIINL
jgi:serine/threonine protein phosphatase PrpC